MYFVYHILTTFVWFVSRLLNGSAVSGLLDDRRKWVRYLKSQRNPWADVDRLLAGEDDGRVRIWFHAASLGEYAILRPVIVALRHRSACRIVLTFFSPTGYEALSTRSGEADVISYLPFDTRRNVRRFLDTVRPAAAVFAVSEYWVNYLTELSRRHIPTYLLSAVITERAPFFRWYGSLYRSLLPAYKQIFVLDDASRERLLALGAGQVRVSGDPLFDNALQKAESPWRDEIVERLAACGDLFIAGSVSDENDLRLVASLAHAHPGQRMLVVPHELSPASLERMSRAFDGRSVLYSECTQATDFSEIQTLIVDVMGVLAYLYRYARWAYVGGGFTPYLHSLVEATAYGIPVAFGPCIERKSSAHQIIRLGVGEVVRTGAELESWYQRHRDGETLEQIHRVASDYVRAGRGATEVVVNEILAQL